MKKALSLFLILSLFVTLFVPAAYASGFEVGELQLSQEVFAPSEAGRLYLYLPVQSGTVDCVLTIYDEFGNAVARFERGGLTKNVHTFIWDIRPAYGNAAGYPSDMFVQDGTYYIEAVCTSGGDSVRRTASCVVDTYAQTLQPESGVPNYTGDHETDYMVSRILEEIPTDGLSTLEKIRAVYTWVQANCYRTGESDFAYFDLDTLAPIIESEGAYYDALYEAGEINYDVQDNLYTRNAKTLLLYRIGSCLEFSALVQVLLARLGIECWIVGGDFYNSDGSVVVHNWNYLRIDGDYYWSDVRIDNASYDRSDRTQLYYDYFLEADTEVWAQRHGWNREEFPERDTLTPAMTDVVSDLPELPQEEPSQEEETEVEILPDEDFDGETETPTSDSPVEAIVNTAPVYMDGVEYDMEAYTIDGYNYVKLRDLAYVLTGTGAQFEVVWLEDSHAVGIFSTYPYTPTGNELTASGLTSDSAELSPCQIYVDGSPVYLSAYLIQSNHYFRLRDIGMILDFAVDWDADAEAIRISTDLPYRE